MCVLASEWRTKTRCSVTAYTYKLGPQRNFLAISTSSTNDGLVNNFFPFFFLFWLFFFPLFPVSPLFFLTWMFSSNRSDPISATTFFSKNIFVCCFFYFLLLLLLATLTTVKHERVSFERMTRKTAIGDLVTYHLPDGRYGRRWGGGKSPFSPFRIESDLNKCNLTREKRRVMSIALIISSMMTIAQRKKRH